jgi:hypothetical protein
MPSVFEQVGESRILATLKFDRLMVNKSAAFVLYGKMFPPFCGSRNIGSKNRAISCIVLFVILRAWIEKHVVESQRFEKVDVEVIL